MIVLLAAALVLLGCAGSGDGAEAQGADGSDTEVGDAPDTAVGDAPDTEVGDAPDPRQWPEVLAAADGATLDLHMWGGSTEINAFVDGVYGPALAELGITLNRVPLADTADAVNAVLGEFEAGRTDPGDGAIDVIWLNGENFATMRQADALLADGWAEHLPNAELVDWGDPAVAFDAGRPVAFSTSPWGSAQFQFVADAARTDVTDLPRSYAELATWIRAEPGRFTYPAPPSFHGTRFLTQWFHELDGEPEAWVTGFDQDRYTEVAEELFDVLEDLAPALWRDGTTYPNDIADLDRLFANGEVDLTFTQLPAGIGANIEAGVLPTTARPFVFDTGTIGDHHYLAIPGNAGDPAAAMVFADLVLDPGLQAAKLDPANGWGDGIAVSPDRLDGEQRAALEGVSASLGDLAVPPEQLERVRTSNPGAELTSRLEADWDRRIRQGQDG
ncbi:MAG: ABC transporter substrate-binding protein [Nitriliruptoraceae bacterium]